MTEAEGVAVDQFHNHWPTQPKVPRFAWCISLGEEPGLRNLVLSYQRVLQDLNCMDLVPMDALQLTVLEIGAEADLAETALADLIAAGQHRLADLPRMPLTFGPAAVVPDGVVLDGKPVDGIAAVRSALRSAMADVGVPDQATLDVRSAAQPTLPIAYANEATTTAFAKATLTFVDAHPVTVTVNQLDLVRFDGRYRSADWSTHDRIALH